MLLSLSTYQHFGNGPVFWLASEDDSIVQSWTQNCREQKLYGHAGVRLSQLFQCTCQRKEVHLLMALTLYFSLSVFLMSVFHMLSSGLCVFCMFVGVD